MKKLIFTAFVIILPCLIKITMINNYYITLQSPLSLTQLGKVGDNIIPMSQVPSVRHPGEKSPPEAPSRKTQEMATALRPCESTAVTFPAPFVSWLTV